MISVRSFRLASLDSFPSLASFLTASTVRSVTPSMSSLSWRISWSSLGAMLDARSPASLNTTSLLPTFAPTSLSFLLSSSEDSSSSMYIMPERPDWPISIAPGSEPFSSSRAPCRARTISSTMSCALPCEPDIVPSIRMTPRALEGALSRSSNGLLFEALEKAWEAWWWTRNQAELYLRKTLVANMRRSAPGAETSSVQVTKAEVPRT
mmetsp:Transcript_31406/g.49162  ORF Transcript_31406/g.49162 Transcript_31406/m.49162 type:complete len:208 (-) Transcript_31406:341-964(-)